MECKKTERGIQVYPVRDLDLAQTLDCGQSFRWTEQEDGSFCGVAYGKYAVMRLNGEILYIDGAETADFSNIWREYLDLDLDYSAVKSELCKIHPILKEAVTYAPGLRILKQEPFEAFCTFILSQNNHIKRIKGMIQRLCENFGKPIGNGAYSFPDAETLAALSEEALSPVRAGFRNKYLLDGARKIVSGEVDLELCRKLPYEEAQKELMKVKGIGVKVSDCILLYGLHRIEAFPMDVWMKRAMEILFPGMKPEDFGPYAGIAQQYIFHYSRMHPELFQQKERIS